MGKNTFFFAVLTKGLAVGLCLALPNSSWAPSRDIFLHAGIKSFLLFPRQDAFEKQAIIPPIESALTQIIHSPSLSQTLGIHWYPIIRLRPENTLVPVLSISKSGENISSLVINDGSTRRIRQFSTDAIAEHGSINPPGDSDLEDLIKFKARYTSSVDFHRLVDVTQEQVPLAQCIVAGREVPNPWSILRLLQEGRDIAGHSPIMIKFGPLYVISEGRHRAIAARLSGMSTSPLKSSKFAISGR